MNYSIGGKTLDAYDDIGLKLLAGSGYLEKVSGIPLADPEILPSLDDSKFGVVFMTKKGEYIRKYPIHDYPHTVLANVYYEMTHEKLPPEARVTAATMIKSASVMFGIKPLPAVAKNAASGNVNDRNYVSLEKVAGAIEEPPEIFKDLRDSYVENRDRYSREERKKLASAMVHSAEKYGFEMPDDLKCFVLKDPEINKEAMLAQVSTRKNLVSDVPEAWGLMDEFLQKSASFTPDEAVSLLEAFDKQFSLDRYWDKGLDPSRILQEKVARYPLASGMSLTDSELAQFVSSNKADLDTMFGKDMAAKISKDPKAILDLPSASRNFIAARIEHERKGLKG